MTDIIPPMAMKVTEVMAEMEVATDIESEF